MPTPECATPGQYYDITTNSCEDCPAGRFANASTHSSARGHCEVCAAGSYSEAGHARCRACARGRYAEAAGAGACVVCPTGKIGPSRGLVSCERCAAGKFNDDFQMIDAARHDADDDCDDCGAGRYSAVDRARCVLCPGGTYVFNMSSCEYCTPGKYAPTAVTEDCIACAAGFATGEAIAATSCSACEAGKQAKPLSVDCTECDKGKASPPRSENCTKCPVGFYADVAGMASCVACAPGRASGSLDGQSSCSLCSAGFAQSQTGQASCKRCARGSYSSGAGSIICLFCAGGRFSNATGAVACMGCEPGRSQASTGQVACSPCQVGEAQASTGSTTCVACSAGKYQATTGSVSCTACERGKAESRSGQGSCTACTAGKYSAGGTSSCQVCDHPTWSKAGASVCLSCIDGYYYDSSGFNDTCKPCPSDGVICTEEGQTLTGLQIKRHYYRLSSSTNDVRKCRSRNACVGGNGSSTYCSAGHAGPLCEVCEEHHFKDAATDSCVNCSAKVLLERTILVGILGFLAVLIVYFYCCRRRAQQHTEDGNDKWIARKARILVNLFQIISSIPFNFSIQFPRGYSGMLSVIGLAGLNFGWVPLDCHFSAHYYERMALTTLASIIVGGMLLCCYLILSRNGNGSSSFSLLLNFMHFLLPVCASSALAVFRCDTFSSEGISYMVIDYSLICESNGHKSGQRLFWEIYAILMVLVFPIGVPLTFGILLYHRRYDLCPKMREYGTSYIFIRQDDWAHDVEIISESRRNRCAHLAFLTDIYKPHCFWFEVAESLRRVALGSMLMLFDNASLTQCTIAIIFCLGGIKVHNYYEPFIDNDDGRLAEGTHWQLFTIFFIVLSISGNVIPTQNEDDLGFLLVAITGFSLVMMLIILARRVYLRTKKKDADILDNAIQQRRDNEESVCGDRDNSSSLMVPKEKEIEYLRRAHIFLEKDAEEAKLRARAVRNEVVAVKEEIRRYQTLIQGITGEKTADAAEHLSEEKQRCQIGDNRSRKDQPQTPTPILMMPRGGAKTSGQSQVDKGVSVHATDQDSDRFSFSDKNNNIEETTDRYLHINGSGVLLTEDGRRYGSEATEPENIAKRKTAAVQVDNNDGAKSAGVLPLYPEDPSSYVPSEVGSQAIISDEEYVSSKLTREYAKKNKATDVEETEESSVNHSDSDSYSEDPSHVSSDAGNRELISGNESDLSDDYTIESTQFQ